jgi:hypothetical protein
MSGFFWLPQDPDHKIPGNLKISDGGGIELETVGNFDKEITAFTDNMALSRIVGHIEKEGYVTLDDCFYRSKNISLNGISKSKLYVNRLMCGVQYNQDEVVLFDSFKFSIEGLDEWLNICGIKAEYDFSKKTASINFISPEEEVFNLSEQLQLKFTFSWTLPGFPVVTEAKITQKAFIELSSTESKPLDYFMLMAYKLVNFICFAIDQTVSIRDVSAKHSDLKREVSNGKFSQIPIKIYYQSPLFSEDVAKIDWHSMLFKFCQIKDNAEEIFINWLNAYDIIEPALNLYFSSKTGAHKYLNGRFLSLVQGLETYHRRTSKETLMPESEFEDLVSDIVKSSADEHKEWLIGLLKHGNEINLRKRLKKIINPFKNLVGTNKIRSKIIRNIVNARNYYTHFNTELESKVVNDQELWDLCMKMEAIFQLHLLKSVGFADEQIILIAKNSHKLKQKLN